MTRACGVALLAALTWWAPERDARADVSRVIIVRDRGADPVVDGAEVRLAAELRAAGFAVEEHAVDSDADARRAVEESGTDGAFATVLLRRAGARAATDVWVADHVTHKTVVRRIGARGSGEAAHRAMALRVVELMRASLVEGIVLPASDDDTSSGAAAGPPPTPTAPPARVPPPDVEAWTREAMSEPQPARRPVLLSLGVAGAFAGPELGLAVAPVLRVAWRASDAWSVGVLAAAPGFGARITAPEGTATVRQELALAEVAFDPPMRGPFGAFVAAGAGGYHMAATGDATAPYTSGQDDAWAALLAAGAGVRLRLSPAASLVLDARELFTLPRPVLVFASRQVGAAMHPGTLGGLSLAVDL